LRDFVDSKGYIGTSEGQILKGTNKAVIGRRINKRITGKEGESMCSGHGSLDRFGFGHVALVKEVKDVSLLGKNETIGSGGGFHTKEVMKRT